jgi:hypothetical protein
VPNLTNASGPLIRFFLSSSDYSTGYFPFISQLYFPKRTVALSLPPPNPFPAYRKYKFNPKLCEDRSQKQTHILIEIRKIQTSINKKACALYSK